LKHYEVPELKFHDEVEHSGSIGHELYSVGDRLVHRQMRENGEDMVYQLYDTKKRKVEYVKRKRHVHADGQLPDLPVSKARRRKNRTGKRKRKAERRRTAKGHCGNNQRLHHGAKPRLLLVQRYP